MPNPQHSSPLALSMLRFVGRLMGLSLRTRLCLPFQLPGMIWKRMLVRSESIHRIDTWNLYTVHLNVKALSMFELSIVRARRGICTW